MIAIPVDKKASTIISKLYGNSPFFALLDEETGSFRVVENKGCGDGIETAKFISSLGATGTMFYHMGGKIYEYFMDKKLKVYSCVKNSLSIDEIYRQFLSKKYKEVTSANSDILLDSGSSSCTCSSK